MFGIRVLIDQNGWNRVWVQLANIGVLKDQNGGSRIGVLLVNICVLKGQNGGNRVCKKGKGITPISE